MKDFALKKYREMFLNSLITILFIGMLRFGFYIRLVNGDPLRKYYFYAALSFLLFVNILIERVKVFTLPNVIICGIIAGFGAWRFLFWYKCGSPHVYRSVFAITVAACLFSIMLISFVVEKKYVRLKNIDWKYLTFLMSALLVLTIFGSFGKGIKYILIMLLVLLVGMTEYSQYKKLVIPFCYSYILVALNVTVGIYVTEGTFAHQRLGKYAPALPPAVATFLLGAVVSSLVLFIHEFITRRRIVLCVVYLLAFGVLTFGVSVVGSRIALGGVIFCGLFTYFSLLKRYEKKRVKTISVVLMLAFFAVAILGLITLANMSKESIDRLVRNEYVNSKLHYWSDRIYSSLYEKETKLILPAGSFWNNLDYFFSDRISIWKTYGENLNLFGHEALEISITEDYLAIHPHNDYLAWTYWYGVIPGGMLIVWFVYTIVEAAKIRKDEENWGYAVFLFSCFVAIIQITDTSFFFRDFTFIIFMFMQYPILLGIGRKSKKESKI